MAAIVVGAVGLSHLALGVHYLVDVLASVEFGAGYLVLATNLTDPSPARAFAVAAVLGILALWITGGTPGGWLAVIGCLGGAMGWWVSMRPSVRNIWGVVAQ